MKRYKIQVKSSNEFIRYFDGDSMLDICVAFWTRIKKEEVVAIETEPLSVTEIARGDATGNDFLECQELFYFIRGYVTDNALQSSRLYGSATAAFDMRNVVRLRTLATNITLGVDLYKLQEAHNDGRGISCVRQVAQDIAWSDIEGARAIAHNEWDKIASYRDVAEWLKKHNIADPSWYISSIAK
jgi:hypothetical protein